MRFMALDVGLCCMIQHDAVRLTWWAMHSSSHSPLLLKTSLHTNGAEDGLATNGLIDHDPICLKVIR